MVSTEAIVEAGVNKMVKQFKEDIEANALDAVHKYLVHPLLFEEGRTYRKVFVGSLTRQQ